MLTQPQGGDMKVAWSPCASWKLLNVLNPSCPDFISDVGTDVQRRALAAVSVSVWRLYVVPACVVSSFVSGYFKAAHWGNLPFCPDSEWDKLTQTGIVSGGCQVIVSRVASTNRLFFSHRSDFCCQQCLRCLIDSFLETLERRSSIMSAIISRLSSFHS